MKNVDAKVAHKIQLHRVSGRPELRVLEIQVSGETAHYSIPSAMLRQLAEGFMKEAEQVEAEATRPN